MKTRTVEATVGKGGVVVLGESFEEGSRIEVRMLEERPEMSQEEWVAHIRKGYGALAHTSFEVPKDSPPSEIEPLR